MPNPTSSFADIKGGDDAIHPAPGSAFSFEDFLSSSIAAELMDATTDTGLVDNAVAEDRGLEDEEGLIKDALDHFFSTSPLSSARTSPTPSRPPTPAPADPPKARKRARSSSPSPSAQQPQPPLDALGAVSAQLDSTSKPRRDKIKSKATKKRKRTKNPGSHNPTPAQTARTHIVPSEEYSTEYNVADIPSASTGFVALPDGKDRVYALPELLAKGFKLVKWDGRTAKPILDKNGLVVAVLVGTPSDPSWSNVCDSAYNILHTKAPQFNFTKKTADHRRGKFPAVNVGISFGGGKMAPGNLCHSNVHTKVLDDILASTPFIRMAGFASKSFASWMPQVHGYYQRDFDKLLHHHPSLHRNFRNSVWAAAALNFGPKTVTARHRDCANLPFGICSITALGKYDPTKGGHIVLWELGLVIEFPPGSTVLIPSAAVSHSNTPISAHECRASFTQYSAGGLFRWVQHGFQVEPEFRKGMSDEEKNEVAADNLARCKLGLSLFPQLSDLRRPTKKAHLGSVPS